MAVIFLPMQQFSRHAAGNRNVILLGNPSFGLFVLTYLSSGGLR
jgi:hypothetical protein